MTPTASAKRAIRLAGIFVVGMVAAGALAIPTARTTAYEDSSFFYEQFVHVEGPALLLIAVFAVVTLFVVARAPDQESQGSAEWRNRPFVVVAIAVAVLLVTVVGTDAVFHRYLFADDEYAAWFQAVVFAHGKTYAQVPAPWCRWISAMTPTSIVAGPNCTWRLSFLPIHSLIRAGFIRLGIDRFGGPVLATAEVMLVASIARKLWPSQPRRMYLAALALATSTQVLFMSMTMFAMETHLLFSLVWLWLYVDDRWWSTAALPWVGVLALGVHSPVPHLLFVPPFILRYLREKRVALVGYMAVVYAFGLMFWRGYLETVPTGVAVHVASVSATAAVGPAMFSLPNTTATIAAAMHIALIATWNAPITTLLVIAAMLRWRALDTFSRDAALSLLVVIVFRAFFGSPTQGEGWGYRYVYANLGCFALLAAVGADVLVQAAGVRRATVLLASSLAVMVAVQLPMRAGQVAGTIRPYYWASQWMASLPDEVVIYPSEAVRWGRQILRNDPFFKPGDKLMERLALDSTARQEIATAFPNRVRFVKTLELLSLGIQPRGVTIGGFRIIIQ